MENKNYKELLKDITTFIFDIDGVLTQCQVLVTNEGELLRSFNVKDGYAIKQAINQGYRIAIITGGNNIGTRRYRCVYGQPLENRAPKRIYGKV